ncbi:PAS domain S-box-containing protein/diguanylate cyclase (GGDEF)-like protein [Paucimonas lemoignei]|uniref:PAS domain S-box-containing protein/diguanylate cyclase (GGDEF)-like protein n=1 Tax=Paucimonas lemoignei TaxID=29443 RepID=A0A4R3HYL9_PAULE|nr:bifunctional diguanylate cyclase/phosphodiesterase [Paucimonas lemoignei]TCS37411.1 PAS domain S-box-containing protein/diguanylate cyclase (GGDEF)-like protein [Paucimonas lemoignei]
MFAGDEKANSIEALTRFAQAIDQVPLVAVQGFDRDGIIRVWNDVSEKLYGISRSEALGRHIRDVLVSCRHHPGWEDEVARIWQAGKPAVPRDMQVATPAGGHVWVCSTMFPIREGEQTTGIYCIDIDITERKQRERDLLDKESRIRELFTKSADAIIMMREGQIQEFNPAALRLFGYGQDTNGLKGAVPYQISPKYQPDGRLSQEKMEEMHAIALKHGSHRFEWQYCTLDKRTFWGEVTLTVLDGSSDAFMYAIVRDITDRKRAEHELRLSAQVFEGSREGIAILDAKWCMMRVNAAFTELTGLQEQDIAGGGRDILRSDVHEPDFYERIKETVQRHGHWQGEIWGRRRNGESFPAWASVSAVRSSDQRIVNYIVIFSDISERKAAEERIRHLSEHDFLTGLPNRVLLLDRMHQAIASARRNRGKLAVLFLDLDRFKNINDSLGHHIGDNLLQALAERLKKCVRSNDTVSRQGGDEFVVMLSNIGDSGQVAHIAGNILHATGMPFYIESHTLTITTCVGISMYPDDGNDVDTLIKNADTAMYHAKESGRNNYQFFDHDMNVRMVERLTLEHELRVALDQNQLVLEYQPELDIGSGRIIGVEALLRWQHPEAGLLAPARFLHAAEASGLIVPIGDWVLQNACRQAKAWYDEGKPMRVGVNLSVIQFRQKDFLQKVRKTLEQTGLPPRYLELEITESVLLDASSSTMATMRALRDMGVALAVDDFGTGYSSLSYLKHFPVDKLKIDQSFVRDLADDVNDAAIIRAILIMAKSLKLKVIAEGVETMAQLDFLREQGCDEFQGHYVTQAVRPAELARFLQ